MKKLPIKEQAGSNSYPPNKIFSAALVLLSMFTFTNAFAESGRSDYDLDDDGLIEINDLSDLNEIRNQLSGGALYGANTGCSEGGTGVCNGFELTTDLDFDTNQDGVMDASDTYWNSGAGWTPIGIRNNQFLAILDGNNHVIKNLYANGSRTGGIGLFGYTVGAEIKNIGLVGDLMSITGWDSVGALAGYSRRTVISNVYNYGTVSGVYRIGGLIGWGESSVTVLNCFNAGDIKGGKRIGGLIGRVDSSFSMTNSFNLGSVELAETSNTGDSGSEAGGLIGFSHQTGNEINSSYNTGTVTGLWRVGGILGYAAVELAVNNTFSVGQVVASYNMGGLLGHISATGDFNNNYWAIDNSEQTTSAGSSEANSYVGLSLDILRCATEANTTSENSSCVSADGAAEGLSSAVTLYKNWDESGAWDFGTSQQLPGLTFNSVVYRDSDADSHIDEEDVFPLDPSEWFDTDGDEIGNNEDTDDDGDSVLDVDDAFPLDGSETNDADGDGIGDNSDTDDDNDGYSDTVEINKGTSSTDANSTPLDTDGDFDPNSTDLDDDNDGTPDATDAFPLDATEDTDTDGDSIGNNADTDDDNDTVLDTEDDFSENPAASIDTDSDGKPDDWLDSCESQCQSDSGLELDDDDDNDGVLDASDAFPTDATETMDTDGDGMGDNSDAFPTDANETLDTDGDGTGNNEDTDDDADGVLDGDDAFPLDEDESVDTDNDGTGDNADIDVNGNGLIEIDSLQDLAAIENHLDGSALYGINTGCPVDDCNGFELTTNLDFDTNQDGKMDEDDAYWNEGLGWVPIGESGYFEATFEGNGHIINNLFINRPNESTNGLFGAMSNASVRHLGLSGLNMSVTGGRYTGALVGRADWGVDFLAVYNTGPVSGSDDVGGLIGYMVFENTLTASYNKGSVTSSSRRVGGLVGYADWDNVINASFSTGLVTGTNNTGGLIGYSDGNTITNSYWATDASGQLASDESSEENSYVGVPLSAITCAIEANTTALNSSCVSLDGSAENLTLPVTLFNDWDNADLNGLWNFGSIEQLPGLAMNSVVHRDVDFDGIVDELDSDNDNDGTNDDVDPFPLDPSEWADSDGDGTGDNSDAFPNDANETVDTDGDGEGNNADTDDDNDGVLDIDDALPLDDSDSVDSDGDGVGENADMDVDGDGLFEISSLNEFNEIRNNLDGTTLFGENTGCPADGCNGFELTTNLDFDTNQDQLMNEEDTYWNEGLGWTVIGNYSNRFSAILDGNGFEIRNLYIVQPEVGYVGLFGFLDSAQIKNLGLSGPLMQVTGNYMVGGLAGGINDNNIIQNCYNTGSIIGGDSVGGLFGGVENDNQISDSYNSGSVQGGGWDTGGIAGYVYSRNQINNIVNSGNISGEGEVAGLIGYVDEANQISASFNTGNIVGTGSYVGGLMGYTWSENVISGNFNSGSVQAINNVGGLIGYMDENNQVNTSFNLGPVEGTGYNIGGLAGEMMDANVISSSFSTGLVTGDASTGGLIGSFDADNAANNSYWATDSSGQLTSYGSSEENSYVGLTLAKLKCAIQANTSASNSDCVSVDGVDENLSGPVVLFNDWGNEALNNVWDFGNENQLPGLNLNGVNYRDSDDDGMLDNIDSDDDNDGILDTVDGFPFIAIDSLTDTDSDGRPDDCDSACVDAGMAADSDDDNDGVLDVDDAYPLLSLDGATDTDQDGRPDDCDQACIDLGMDSDTDDDNDGVLDTNDAYPLISIGDLTDTDLDGRPNDCDQACIDSGMSHDTDDDNDGVLDTNDAYPLISVGALTDTDNDGRPNDCDQACIDLGMDSDSDDDNDGVLDIDDAYPLISVADFTDTDGDGRPNDCDQACSDLGMSPDTDDDNDGVLDIFDAYPLIHIGQLTDTDLDGRPNDCDQACIDAGMISDTDDDNDGVLDIADGFPLISVGDFTDTDRDGRPDECDEYCIDLGMSQDTDDDNDGILDVTDGFPLISIGDLTDTDSDGRPNDCDQDCTDLGMSADADDDNDEVLDTIDGFPLISIGELTDTDSDGRPNDCDQACIDLGMNADTDDDNDGVLDINDAYPLISLNGLTDTDQDGRPDNCEDNCNGMTSDTDDDNDDILDTLDGFPLISIGDLTDTDNDGRPDDCDIDCNGMSPDTDDDNDEVLDTADAFPLDETESNDFDSDGTGDNADTDDDNDGVLDVDDTDNNADNGVPELTLVPDETSLAVNSEDGTTVSQIWDEDFFAQFQAYDVVDGYELTFEASLNGEILVTDEEGVIELPTGRLQMEWRAKDTAGNLSTPLIQIMNVYPRVQFELSESISGDESSADIKVILSGESPVYPVRIVVMMDSDASDVSQDDFDLSFDMNAVHWVVIEDNQDPEQPSLEGYLNVAVAINDVNEYDETLVLDLVGVAAVAGQDENLYSVNELKDQHTLTIAYENVAPEMQVTIEQGGAQIILEQDQLASITQDGGTVTVTIWVDDANDTDEHTLEWDLTALGVIEPVGRVLTFDPAELEEGDFNIEVSATDSAPDSLSCATNIRMTVVLPVIEEPTDASGGAGSLWWLVFILFGLTIPKRRSL